MTMNDLHWPVHLACSGHRRQPVRRPRRARSTSCGGSSRARAAEVIHLGHNRSVARGRRRGAAGGRRRASAVVVLPGRPRGVLRVPRRALRARRALSHVRWYGGGGGVIVPTEIERLRALGRHRIFSPDDGQRMGLAGDDQHDRRRLRRRPRGDRPVGRAAADRSTDRDRPRDHRRGAGPAARRRARAELAERRGRSHAPVARHHRHRRLGQVVAHRRAASAASALDQRGQARVAVIAVDPTRRKAAARCSATASA